MPRANIYSTPSVVVGERKTFANEFLRRATVGVVDRGGRELYGITGVRTSEEVKVGMGIIFGLEKGNFEGERDCVVYGYKNTDKSIN